MGFLSYNLHYYQKELQKLGTSPAAPERLYHTRQLLRMLDDLTDEGYTELNRRMEAEFSGVSCLRDYLKRNHAAPFSSPETPACRSSLTYTGQDIGLRAAISQAMRAAAAVPESAPIPFAGRLRRFCQWLGYEEKTAYIFLLRDTLLPFVFYAARGRERIYPWLLSRSSFAALTGQPNADDEIRSSIYRALEAGCIDFPAFSRSVLPDIRQTMALYPYAETTLRSMLAGIDADRILVVESGCAGTFPLLLMALDERVEIRMYTTYPYLTGVFCSRVFSARYEENRMFETMASQEAYFRFSKMQDERFYVQTCADEEMEQQALREIREMLK